MHQPCDVSGVQTGTRLSDVMASALDRERTALLHEIGQIRAVDEFDDQEVHVAVVIDVVCANDVRMIEGRGRAGFTM